MLIEDSVWPLDKGKIVPLLPIALLQFNGFQNSILKAEKELKINISIHPKYGSAHIQIIFGQTKQPFIVDTLTLAILIYLEEFEYTSSLSKLLN